MGIPELWRLIDETTPPVGEILALADLSTDYFLKYGRPMRIAVDEAGWRFKNLTDAQVAFIRTKEPAANPIEKAIMWRLIRLMRLNIQLIFIFDGPARPWKRGRTAGRIDYEKIRLLEQLLDRLRIPRHRAPAEAEAECARLQQLGIVDAVWSDDADSLMFGCTMLIRDHRPKDAKKNDNKRDIKLVEVYQAATIKQRLGLDQAGILMFVLLVGGDYDAKGLEGCGPVAALEAVRSQSGRLSTALWHSLPNQRDLSTWALGLAEYFLGESTRRVHVPAGFPRELHYKNYRFPKVSSDQQLHDLNGLRRGWALPIDEAKLRTFFQQRFNIWTKGYLKHVVPALLVRTLVSTAKGEEERNLRFEITIPARRGKQAGQDIRQVKITFRGHLVSTLDLLTEPHDQEDWTKLRGEKGDSFDPSLPIEAEVVESVLVHGLGRPKYDELVAANGKPQTRKRKQAANQGDPDAEESAAPKPAKKARSRKAEETEVASEGNGLTKQSRTPENSDTERSLESPSLTKPSHTPKGFRMPTGWTSTSPRMAMPMSQTSIPSHHESVFVDIISDDEDFNDHGPYLDQVSRPANQAAEHDDPDLAEAIRLSLLDTEYHKTPLSRQNASFAGALKIPDRKADIPLRAPGTLTPDRQAIARARLAHLENTKVPVQVPTLPAASSVSKITFDSQYGRLDVIDLTDD